MPKLLSISCKSEMLKCLTLQSDMFRKKPIHKYTNSMFYFYLVTETTCDLFGNKFNTNKKYC